MDEDRESFELVADPGAFLVKDGMPTNSMEDVDTMENYMGLQDVEEYQQRSLTSTMSFQPHRSGTSIIKHSIETSASAKEGCSERFASFEQEKSDLKTSLIVGEQSKDSSDAHSCKGTLCERSCKKSATQIKL